jgi:alcohol dehydrogenase (cytochrome c)
MRSRRIPPLLLVVGLHGGWPCLVTAQGMAPYRPVTDQRLGNPGTRWLYRRQLPVDLRPGHRTNCGVGLFEDKVYLATLDAHLVALDATGQVVWDTTVDDYTQGASLTLAPLVAKGKVMVGMAGGGYGLRGYIAAFDARTGDEVWKTHTIPAPGEPGHDTWAGESWRTGGGLVEITGQYDPFRNLAYWGTGSPSPQPAEAHRGDHLYTSAVLVIDVDTGALRTHFQYQWNDAWGWGEVSPPLLVDIPRDGRTINALVHPARNGYLYRLERTADAIRFIDAKPYVTQNVFTGLDPQTGRPSYDPVRRLRDGTTASFCPPIGAARLGPRRPTTRTQGIFICRPMRTSAARWQGNRHRTHRASSPWALTGRPPA